MHWLVESIGSPLLEELMSDIRNLRMNRKLRKNILRRYASPLGPGGGEG